MKRNTEPKICTEQVKQQTPKLASESWISIRYDDFWETVYSKDMVNKDLGIFHGSNLFFTSREVRDDWDSCVIQCQFVYEDHNGREPI